MSPILSFFGGSRATSVFARNSHGARGLRASVPVEGTEERETLRRDVLSAAEEEGGKKHSIDSRSLPSLDLPLASLPRPPFGLPFSTSTEKKKKIKTVQANTTRFMFDGERIGEEHTPAALGLEDGDQIDAMVEQLGGGSEV